MTLIELSGDLTTESKQHTIEGRKEISLEYNSDMKKAVLHSTLVALLNDPVLSDVPKEPTLTDVDTLINLELGSAMRISILKLDGSCFDVTVMNSATVKDLKQAVRKRIDDSEESKMPNSSEFFFRNISSVTASVTENKEGLKFLVTAGPRARKMVGIWLFASAAWVFNMVVLGGVTRLTRSGLSMIDWKFTGSLPPLMDEDWLAEFEKYKQSPEYKWPVQIACEQRDED